MSAGRDPVTKRYRYVSRSFAGTKKDAEAALAALLTEVNSGAGGHKGSDATVGEVVEQWLDLKRESLSVTTWEAYAGKARFRLIPALGSIPVRKLTVRDIDGFYRGLRREQQLAASTIRQIHNVLTGALDQAVRWGWRNDNPARLATLPPQHQSEVHAPSPVAVLAAIEAANDEFSTFLRVSAAVGGRRGEVGALRWPVVDLDGAELKIVRALVESADGSIFEKDTKTHQARRVALDPGTVAALREWRRIVEKRAADAGVELLADGFVFSAEVDGSRPWRPYHWTSVWRRVRDKSGIDPAVRLHDLRHFAATHLLDAGVPVKTVSSRLGHARPGTTLNVYAQFIPASDRSAADVMGRILTRPTPTTIESLIPETGEEPAAG
ncbi:MAG: site-specific integrase [Actinomycetota bacterium]|nr:site-specific integrase [Actinomycetota bacterium]